MEMISIGHQEKANPGECAICYEAYKTPSKSRAPKTLQCGHSMCLHCLKKLVCHSSLLSFVVCPFCRCVAIIPEEGVQALKTDEETLRRASSVTVISSISEDTYSQSSGVSSAGSSPYFSVELGNSPRPSIFTISDVVPSDQGQFWGGRYMQQIRSTYLQGISRRVAQSEAHPSSVTMPISADKLRLCFALGLIVLIACVFFLIIFFK
ncbi:E3 ubiquitin- ligase TRIM23-like [Pelobates cultripes]|uniref:E3 ubiquitin-protein ligase RNF182 n=1 Tax=Pelobates cultripes TaxID=61616 RepID=A0AAD1T7L9_PELCU|nr:E3 ubiquitin- ligase TRIM23-like [Pelobates cultripes]